jgi:hypothetical protein
MPTPTSTSKREQYEAAVAEGLDPDPKDYGLTADAARSNARRRTESDDVPESFGDLDAESIYARFNGRM